MIDPISVPLSSSIGEAGPFFESRHAALAETLGASLPAARERLHGDGRAVAEAMGALGLYRHLVPDAGASIDVRALAVVREALAQVSPMADAIFAVQGLGSYPVLAFGNEPQRAATLPGVVAGTRIGAFALTEPEAGSDVASLRTRATRDGDGWRLDGDKTLISNVGIADHYVVFANADPAAGRKGITAFLVQRGTPGVHETPLPMSSPHPLGALRFEGCRVGDDARVGELGKGFAIAMQTLDTFRITVGAAANGMAARALALAAARVKARVQFGKPLAEQQQVQAYLAEMFTELSAGRLLVARAAHAKDHGASQTSLHAATAKLFATEAAQRVIDRAVQLFGGSGVLLGSEVEALYRDIRPLRIYEGTSEIQRLIIAKALLSSTG